MGKRKWACSFVLSLCLSGSYAQVPEPAVQSKSALTGDTKPDTTQTDRPVFACAETVIEVGKIPVTFPPLTNTFTITNEGTGPLVLQLAELPCECLIYDLDKSTIPPGGQARLTLSLDIAAKRGHFWDKIRYSTNDPARPVVMFGFEGFAFDRVDIEYPDVNFGELDAQSLPTFRYPFQLTVNDPSIPALSRIRSRQGYLAGDFVEDSPGIFQITIKFANTPEEGPFEDVLELQFQGDPIPGLPDVGFLDPVTKQPRGTIPRPETLLLNYKGYIRSGIVPLRRSIPISEFIPYTPAGRAFYLQSNTVFHVTGIKSDPFICANAEPLVYQAPSGKYWQKVVLRADLARLPPPTPPYLWRVEVLTDDPVSPRVLLFIPDNRRLPNAPGDRPQPGPGF